MSDGISWAHEQEKDDSDQAPAAVTPPAPAPVLGTNPKDLVGAKKPALSLVPPSSTLYQAMAMADGARKYGPYNWRGNKVVAMIYIDAAMRHLQAYLDGEEVASDSGVHHLAHALASIGIIVDAKETGNLIDNRPAKGAAPKIIAEYEAAQKAKAAAKQGA